MYTLTTLKLLEDFRNDHKTPKGSGVKQFKVEKDKQILRGLPTMDEHFKSQ